MKYLDLKTILIIALVAVILIMRACGDKSEKPQEIIQVEGKPYIVVKREVDTLYKEVIKKVVKEGKTIYKDTPVYVEVPQIVDTQKILKDFYTKNIYRDTLKLSDSLGYVAVSDTIFKNSILTRTWDSHVNKITITDKVFLKDLPKNQVFFGGVVGFDRVNVVNFVGPSLVFKNKKDNLYSLSFGYGLNRSFSLQGGIYWKIRLKK